MLSNKLANTSISLFSVLIPHFGCSSSTYKHNEVTTTHSVLSSVVIMAFQAVSRRSSASNVASTPSRPQMVGIKPVHAATRASKRCCAPVKAQADREGADVDVVVRKRDIFTAATGAVALSFAQRWASMPSGWPWMPLAYGTPHCGQGTASHRPLGSFIEVNSFIEKTFDCIELTIFLEVPLL